jgi:predicted nucleic acid-binding protein
MFLLDTVALSDLDKPLPNAGLCDWFKTVDIIDLHLSVISVAEFWSGIIRLPQSARRRGLEVSFHLLEDRFPGRILPVDQAVSVTYAEIQLKKGPLPILDAFIGATALVHRLTVVTRNTGDIARTGAMITDPWS